MGYPWVWFFEITKDCCLEKNVFGALGLFSEGVGEAGRERDKDRYSGNEAELWKTLLGRF